MPHLYWAINGSIPHDIPTGDAYVARGKAPWISEMCGYSSATPSDSPTLTRALALALTLTLTLALAFTLTLTLALALTPSPTRYGYSFGAATAGVQHVMTHGVF